MKEVSFLISFLLSSTLYAYQDSDLDGVIDAQDKCPNTPFSELVDITGCTTQILYSQHHYDIILGTSYSDSDFQTLNKTDTLSTSLQVDYYYKNFSLGLSTSYFKTQGSSYSDTGLNDSYINASYQFTTQESLFVRVSLGVILPTYSADLKNNNIDYTSSLNLSYSIERINLFGGFSYTWVMDDNVKNAITNINVTYQNSLALSAGAGYYASDKLYISLSYNQSDSIYKSIEDIKTVSAYVYYSIDEHWFSTFSYAKGMSDSASKNYLSLRLGYYF